MLLWPLYEWRGDKLVEPMKVLKGWLDPIVKETVEKKKKRKAEAGSKDASTMKEEERNYLEFLAESTDGVYSCSRFFTLG
jgi:hypothetical protein